MKIPKISAELAEETGWHIGDGTMNFYKNKNKIKGSYALRGHIIDDLSHYKMIIKPIYKELYDLDISLRTMPSTGCYGFQKWSNELVKFKQKILNLPLGKKINIKIPEQFFKRYNKEVIRGIFDTDGTLYLEPKNRKLYPRIIIHDISKELVSQLHILTKRLGFRSTMHMDNREKYGWNNLYRVEVRGDKMLHKWFKIIKPQNHKYINKYQYYLDNS